MVIHAGETLPVRALANASYRECLDHWMKKRPAPSEPYDSLNRFSRLAENMAKFKGSEGDAVDMYAYGLLAGVAAPNTRWSLSFDTGSRVFYLKSYRNPRARFVDRKKIDFSCEHPTAMLDAHSDREGDITASFHDFSHDEVSRHMVTARKYFRPDVSEELVAKVLAFFESFSCEPAKK